MTSKVETATAVRLSEILKEAHRQDKLCEVLGEALGCAGVMVTLVQEEGVQHVGTSKIGDQRAFAIVEAVGALLETHMPVIVAAYGGGR